MLFYGHHLVTKPNQYLMGTTDQPLAATIMGNICIGMGTVISRLSWASVLLFTLGSIWLTYYNSN